MCLLVLGWALLAGAAPEQDGSLRLMILKLQEPPGALSSGPSRQQEFIKAILGEDRGFQHPHVVGLIGVGDARELEEMIWPLNRALGPNEGSYVTWITGGGPEGQKLGMLSLFPLAGFQEVFEPGPGPRIFYCMLDAPGGLLHVILADETLDEGKGSGGGISLERGAARLAGTILKLDPEARILIMGALEPQLIFQNLQDRESFGWASCPRVGEGFPWVMIYSQQLGPGKSAVGVSGNHPESCAVELQGVRKSN